jgi:PAS domain S-box-containing protein
MGTRVLILEHLRDAWRKLTQPWPLRAYLVAFGLALILPGLLFAAIAVITFRSADRAAQDQAALEIARAASNSLDSELSGMIMALRALATSEALEQGDFASFYRQAKRVARDRVTIIVLRNLDNRQLLNTHVPWGSELPISGDPLTDAEVIARGEPWISDMFTGPIAQVPLFSVNLPVTLADGRQIVLSMLRPAESLLAVLRKSGLPPLWEGGISDRRNRILVRTKDHQRLIGQTLAPETVERTRGPEGVWPTTNLMGELVLRGYATSRISGWIVAAWIPMHILDEPYWQSLRIVLLGGAGSIALSLLLAGLFGRLMERPIQDISEAAARLGRDGTVPLPATFPLHEANTVSMALRQAAQQIMERREAAQRHEARIREAHERMALALDITGLGTWDRDLVTNNVVWSEGMYRIFGRGHDEFHGNPDQVLSFVHPDDRAAFRKAFEDTIQGSGTGFGQEFRIVRPDGEVRWVLRRAQVIRSGDGRPLSMLGVALDITERRDREDHIAFLMRELAHRSKNLVAVIQAIAHQTARHSDNVSEFTERFSSRLVSLARTHDLLTGKERNGAVLEDLVHAQLEPFAERDSGRLSVKGPPIVLDEGATQSVGLALHELATNAAKYGALSVPQGRVGIEWTLIEGAGGRQSLRLTWRERNGPLVRKPTRKGFGHIVVERTLAESLQGEVRLDFAPDGLRWEVELPPDRFYILDMPAAVKDARPVQGKSASAGH